MSTISNNITKKEKTNVQNIISCIDNPVSRKRAYVSILAINALTKHIKNQKIYVNQSGNCSNNPLIMNEFDVADIRLENNIRIDVRAIVGNSYPQMWIPKTHHTYKFSPDIYVGAQINEKLDKLEFVGFIAAKELDSLSGNKNYIIIDSSYLRPMSDLTGAIKTIIPKQYLHTAEDHGSAKDLFLSYLDNTISGLSKEYLVRHLAVCESCRNDFYELYEFNKKISNFQNKANLLNYFDLNNSEDKSEESSDITLKPGVLNVIKNAFNKNTNANEHGHIALSSILNQEKFEIKRTPEFKNLNISEVRDIEDALDVLYETEQDYQVITEEDILSELDNEEITEEDILSELAEQGITEEIQSPLEIIENYSEEITEEAGLTYTSDKKIIRKFTKQFKSVKNLVIIKEKANEKTTRKYTKCFTPAQKLSVLDIISIKSSDCANNPNTNEDEKVFKNLADKIKKHLEIIAKDHPFNTIDHKSLGLENSIKCAKLFEYQYNLLQEQGKLDNFKAMEVTEISEEIIEQTLTSEEISEDDLQIKDILASLDDIEIIDNEEAIKILYNQNESLKEETQIEENIIEIDNSNKKSQLIKVASVLAAAGVLTCTGLVLNSHFNNNSDILSQKPSANSNLASAAYNNPEQSNPLQMTNKEVKDQKIQPISGLKERLSSINQESQIAQTSQPRSLNVTKYKNINDVLANAFVTQGTGINISNISWEVGLSLAGDPVLKNYFMATGQIIKTALSRELLSATDRAANDQIKINVILGINGTLEDCKIKLSSGSKQIDEIVLQTLKETLSYTKLPVIQSDRKKINAGIIINL